jgi:prepilin-type N-terminal cleavage/methylation domain-containing protein
MRATFSRSRNRARGFSLLEILIALTLLSIALLAMVPLFSTAAWSARGSRDLNRAAQLARAYVDKLRNTPYPNIGIDPVTNTPCPGTPPTCTPPAGEVTGEPTATVSWTVQRVDGTAYDFVTEPTPRIKRIRVTVTVECPDCTGGQRQVEMETLVSERS